MYTKLFKTINYKFKNESLLEEAFTHPSLSVRQDKICNYERLEFLGDSILSAITTSYLFSKFPKAQEGELSKLKSVFVSHNSLSLIAKKLELGEYLKMTKGEEHNNGRNNDNNLENIMESLIGAIYIDSNFITVQTIITDLLEKYKNELLIFIQPPKTELQEWLQKKTKTLPDYRLISKTDDKSNPIFTMGLKIDNYGDLTIEGKNIKETETLLAIEMLKIIKKSK